MVNKKLVSLLYYTSCKPMWSTRKLLIMRSKEIPMKFDNLSINNNEKKRIKNRMLRL